ncbi:MAG TPA: OmpA family protein [Saprospiraceae bacterium]|nr:OmpA family protein [Saprospiraceae bacterium]HMQ81714.1 OmpA family protein [Saprospiraceae bacterium]
MRNCLLPLLLLVVLSNRTAGQPEGSAPQLLPEEINSPYDESYPLISTDGKSLLFTRKGHPRNIGFEDREDVWISHLQTDGLWSPAINLGTPANNASPNRAIGMNASNTQLYLFYREQGQVFRVEKDGRLWSALHPIAIASLPIIPQSSQLHIGSSNIMLLSLLQSANEQRDLYVLKPIEHQGWSDTLHLPAAINTAYDERDGFLAADEKTLYFSSNRPGGAGGYDLYYSRRLDESWNNWSLPLPLAGNINSTYDEFSPSVPASGNPLYYMRKIPQENSNIYQTVLTVDQQPIPVVLLTTQLIDAQSKALVPASIDLKSQDGQVSIPVQEIPASGIHTLVLSGRDKIALFAQVPGYFPVAKTLTDGIAVDEEELDYDPFQLIASTDYRDKPVLQEMETMRFQLQQLDEELMALNELREQKKAEALELRTQWALSLDMSDPKLDALRHKYQQYLHQIQTDTIPDSPLEVPSDYDELEDMTSRFQRFYDYQKQLQEQREKEAQEEDFIWEEDFDPMAPTAETALDQENWSEKILYEVESSLRESLYTNARQELEQELSKEEQAKMQTNAEAFKQELGLSFQSQETNHWVAKGAAPSGNAQEADWEIELRNDLRAAINTDTESWEALEKEVKNAMKVDMLYWLKQGQREDLQETWEARLQTIDIALPSDDVSALEPVENPPAQYQEIEQQIALFSLAKGQLIPLEDIVFEANKSALKAASYQALENLLSFFQSNPSVIAEIRVHAGGQLENSHAARLTAIRAEVLADYLIGHGIPEQRIRYKGLGNSEHVADPKSPEGQRLNQRVELLILEM